MRSSGSTDKRLSTTTFEENNSSMGHAGSTMDDKDSVFRDHSASDFDAQPMATSRVATHTSLGHIATLVSMCDGEPRLSLNKDLRQPSVPTVLGAGESGYTPGDYKENEEEEEEEEEDGPGHFEATPSPGEQDRPDIFQQTQSTFKNSQFSFG